MNPLTGFLHWSAQQGRLLLIAGLVAGISLPALAMQLRPWLQELVALLMFLAALRIGPKNAIGALSDIPKFSLVSLIYQVVLPLIFIVIFSVLGMLNTLLATAIILMASAAPVSGSPNLTIMVGGDPAPALRLLVISTAALPLTVIPVFYWVPAFGSPVSVLVASAKLLAVIAVATALAFAIRLYFFKEPKQSTITAIDGCSALAMMVIVVGLMSSVGSTLAENPLMFFQWLIAAFAINFGLQFIAYWYLGKAGFVNERVPFSISAGNRNIALFLVALPSATIDPVLLFIGCYQIPMYLTPILLRKLYAQ